MIKLSFKTFFWCLLAISSIASANHKPCCEFAQSLVEVKAGYFFFSDSKMRKVYDKGGFDIQLSTTYPLWCLNSGWTLSAYGALEYLQCSGRSLNGDQKTTFWSIPVNAGLKSTYTISCNLDYYLTLGPRYFFIHQHNHSSFVYKNKSRNGFGFFLNTGLTYRLCDNFVLDIFGEYSYAKAHFQSHRSSVYTRNIQVGGFTLGTGLGYKF